LTKHLMTSRKTNLTNISVAKVIIMVSRKGRVKDTQAV
jgi:hypothetical protein